MDRLTAIRTLNHMLLAEMPEYQPQARKFPRDTAGQRRLLRSLMNVRPPRPLDPRFLQMQDELLSAEREAKGVVDGDSLPVTPADSRVAVWQGDITRLAVDAVVDADNAALLGCFRPCHGCVDNAIHSAAGLQLRDECNEIMTAQGRPEPAGKAKLTKGYNLPAKYVLHTVGPIVQGRVSPRNRAELASCYRSCLLLAAERELRSIRDMYSGGFYPFQTPEEYWAWWSRHILVNRYVRAPRPVYDQLLELVRDRDYFVLTTNVDHQFQMAGFDKTRLFYTQGDYGLWQCSKPCCQETYDNEETVRRMAAEQRDMRIPAELIPRCPKCGRPQTPNLRCDDTFVEDAGWHAAASRYEDFLRRHRSGRVVYLELGVGANTPVIIKFPFWKYTHDNPDALYACVNLGEAAAPREIAQRSVCVDADIGSVVELLLQQTN